MAKSVNERQAEQKIRDLKRGIIKMSVKVDAKVFGSLKQITKEENKTLKEVVGELLPQAIHQRNQVKQREKINRGLSSQSKPSQ